MRRKIFSIVFLAVICSLSIVAFGQSSNFIEDLLTIKQFAVLTNFQSPALHRGTKSAQTTSKEIPDNVLWYIVFSMNENLEKEAEKLNREGKDGTLFSAYFRRQGKLSAENEKVLKDKSNDFEKEIKPFIQEAKKIIDEARKKSKGGTGTTDSPPPALEELQKQRDEITLRYRDSFKQAVGESAFNEFSGFLTQDFTRGATQTGSGTSRNAPQSPEISYGISHIIYNDSPPIPLVSGWGETYFDWYLGYYYDPKVFSVLADETANYALAYGDDIGYADIIPAYVQHPTFVSTRGHYYCVVSDHYKVDAFILSPEYSGGRNIDSLMKSRLLRYRPKIFGHA